MHLDVPFVTALVSEQFPQFSHLPIRPVAHSGWDNRTFRLGDSLTVRLPSAARYSSQVSKEQRWLPWLAPQLPLAIPTPVAVGESARGYPFRWSIYAWLDGEQARLDRIDDLNAFAAELAGFLAVLQGIDTAGGPPAGQQNFHRGGELMVYDAETRACLDTLSSELNVAALTAIWEAALSATWTGPPQWLHGDVAAGNLLTHGGQLSAVIDFGQLGVGDPACDTTIAWTLLDRTSRQVFRDRLDVPDDAWARGRGWALWKALLIMRAHPPPALQRLDALRVIEALQT